MHNIVKFFSFILIISSCGGGGGGSSSSGSSGVIPTPSAPSFNSFIANSDLIVINNDVTLTWSTSNTNTCTRGGDWSGAAATSGTSSVKLTELRSYTFILTCSGTSGTQDATASISVNVQADPNGSIGYEIYNEVKDSYCKTPANDSSDYWIDNFDSSIINPDIYTFQQGSGFFDSNGTFIQGWGNNEEQYYTSDAPNAAKNYNSETNSTENAFIDDGKLVIQAIYNTTTPFEDPYCINRDCNYVADHTSARIITSKSNGKTGLLVGTDTETTACFKVPAGTGFWPAIWFLPQGFIEGEKSWPRDGEMDIMEARGRIAQTIGSAVHWGPPRELYSVDAQVPLAVNFQDTFHSLTFKRIENSIEVYLDTMTEPFYEFNSTSNRIMNDYWPYNESFYLILNVAIGGDFDSGRLDNNAICKDEQCSNLSNPSRGRFEIDYIEIKSTD